MALLATTIVFADIPAATADDAVPSASEVVDVLEDLVNDDLDHIVGVDIEDAVDERESPVDLPDHGGNEVTFDDSQFTVTLPSAGVAAFDRGTTVFTGTATGASTAAQPTAEGVRLLTVIADHDAPTDYRFELGVPDGAAATLASDGSVEVTDADGQRIATVAAPWAVDADGKPFPTRFILKGDVLTQTVQFEGAALPLVADPAVTVATKACGTKDSGCLSPTVLDRLMELQHPITTRSEVRSLILQDAAAAKLAPDVLANELISEARAADVVGDGSSTVARTTPVNPDGGGEDARVKIKNARHPGDIFYTSSYLAGVSVPIKVEGKWKVKGRVGINHGHVGIFSRVDERPMVVQATSQGVKEMPRKEVTVIPDGTARIMEVIGDGVDQALRNKAVAEARAREGRPYNYVFMANRRDSKRLNCSQLVWLAYIEASGGQVDLDKEPGWKPNLSVYPRDIRDSQRVRAYAWQ